MAKQIIVTISDTQEKALLTDMISIQEWLQNAINVKANDVMRIIIQENTDKNPGKLSLSEKDSIINSLSLKTAAQKHAELEAK